MQINNTTAEITHISDFNNVLDLDGFYFGYAYNSKYESSQSLWSKLKITFPSFFTQRVLFNYIMQFLM